MAPPESHGEFVPGRSRDPVGVNGRRRIIGTPPAIVPVEEVFAAVQADAIYQQIRGVLGKYGRSPQSGLRHLLEQFTLVQEFERASR